MKKGNVANQREHLILLLANIDSRNKNYEEYELVYPLSFVYDLRMFLYATMYMSKHLSSELHNYTFAEMLNIVNEFLQLDNNTVDLLMDKIFKNYRSWCAYLHCPSNIT